MTHRLLRMRHWATCTLLAVAGGFLCASPAVAQQGQPPRPISYSRDIRPILSENCFYCHGQDPNHRKADLRLDLRESALKEGAIVPGKPDQSKLAARITREGKKRMPPPDSHRNLTPEQKEVLKQWIAQGAAYQQHWAFVAPVRPAPPQVAHDGWPRNEIDRFVLARL